MSAWCGVKVRGWGLAIAVIVSIWLDACTLHAIGLGRHAHPGLSAWHPAAPPRVDGEAVVRTVTGHFVARSTDVQTVVWSRRRSDGLCLLRCYSLANHRWTVLASGVHGKIVDLQAGDIERRGVDDVVLGLVQRSKLDIVPRLRLYVYAVDPHLGFVPKWRGSGLSHPHRSFILLKTSSGCDLAAVERNTLPEYSKYDWLGVYRWNGFGVRRIWEAPVRGHIVRLIPTTRGGFRVDRVVDGRRSDISLLPVHNHSGELDYASSSIEVNRSQ